MDTITHEPELDAADKLRRLAKDSGLHEAEYAASLGLDPASFSLLVNRRRMPKLATMRRIKEATGGRVQYEDWEKGMDRRSPRAA